MNCVWLCHNAHTPFSPSVNSITKSSSVYNRHFSASYDDSKRIEITPINCDGLRDDEGRMRGAAGEDDRGGTGEDQGGEARGESGGGC